MLVLLLIYQVLAVTDDSVLFNSTLNSTLKYGSFIQLIPNSFGMGTNDQYPIIGRAIINLTISSPTRSEFDFIIADSPYNQFYICYVYLSERNAEECRRLVYELCKPCPKNSTYVRVLVSQFLQSVMSVQLNYKDTITYSNSLNTICFLGCEGLDIGSFIVANTSYSNFLNAATYIIIDNSPFPDLSICNVNFQNCQNSSTVIVPNSDSLVSFCESVRNISCVQQFQNITEPELQLTFDFNVTVIPDNYPYYVQYMVMIILLIIIVFLFIILCVVAFRFKKVKKRKMQMIIKCK